MIKFHIKLFDLHFWKCKLGKNLNNSIITEMAVQQGELSRNFITEKGRLHDETLFWRCCDAGQWLTNCPVDLSSIQEIILEVESSFRDILPQLTCFPVWGWRRGGGVAVPTTISTTGEGLVVVLRSDFVMCHDIGAVKCSKPLLLPQRTSKWKQSDDMHENCFEQALIV